MKSNKLLCLIFFVLLLFTQNSCIQTKVFTESTNGLKITTFENNKGSINVTLPETLPGGKIISGTVVTEVKGENESQQQKNSALLNKYTLEIQDQSESPMTKVHTWEIPNSPDGNHVYLLLKDPKGKQLADALFPVEEYSGAKPKNNLSTSDFKIPKYVPGGEEETIYGAFDGDIKSTSVKINGVESNLLAETPNQVFFEVPEDVTGPADVELSENDINTTQKTNVLHLDVTADKLTLMKGEQTTIRFKVSGLDGLETKVPLEYKNLSPSTIVMEGGDENEILINPEQDAPEGIFTHEVTINSKMRGQFSVSGSIISANNEMDIAEKQDSVLCDCILNGNSYLLSPEMCEELYNSSENVPEIPDEVIEPYHLYFENTLEVYPLGEPIKLQVSPGYSDYETVAVSFSYKSMNDSLWHTLGTDTTGNDGWGIEFTPNTMYQGIAEIKAEGVNQQNTLATSTFYTQIGGLSLIDAPTDVVYSVSESDINRARNRANNARNAKENELERLRRLRDRLAGENQRHRENEARADELERIDNILDKVPKTYRDSINALLDSLQNIRRQLPEKIDSVALRTARDEAQARLKACRDRLEKLREQQQELENRKKQLKEEQDTKLKELDDFFTQNGYTGRYGWHEDGRHWYGYVGDENSNDLTFAEIYDHTQPLRNLKKEYMNVLKQLDNLSDDIASAQEDCDRLEEEANEAEEAVQNNDLYTAVQLSVSDFCRQIEQLLRPLLKWCIDNPDNCYFEDQIRSLMQDCSTDSISWAHFWQNFEDLLDNKQQQEDRFRGNAENAADDAASTQDEIDQSEDRIDELSEEEQRQNAEAERLRQQREREQEEARLRREEQERERNRIIPKPYLDEPVDPSDDQLKFQAQLLFRQLYTELLIDEGPCDCKTKAVALANNTNSIVSDIIGRIGVGVAFAPLEAFPGIGLAGRLGISVVKALASSIYGGESLSDELIKNIFSAIGGELFPKLLGNEFAGNRLNDLADKGLEEILEEEGVRAIQWEGSTNLRECGEVSGKTTLLVNPNTGWVVIMIKIDDCPLVIIKYRINDDGVAISKPIIRTVGG